MKFIKYMIAAENIENLLVNHFSQKTILCLIVESGGGLEIANFGKKPLQRI